MREEQPERATRNDRSVGGSAGQSSDTLDAEGKPKVEGTQDTWTEKAKDVIGPAAGPPRHYPTTDTSVRRLFRGDAPWVPTATSVRSPDDFSEARYAVADERVAESSETVEHVHARGDPVPRAPFPNAVGGRTRAREQAILGHVEHVEQVLRKLLGQDQHGDQCIGF